MYKNIIFDLGGVVVDFNPRDFLMDHFLNKTAEDITYDLTFGSKEWEEMDRGVLARSAANDLMLENAARCGRTFEVRTVIEEWESILKTKSKTVEMMRNLKDAGYRLYYLSNIASDTLAELRERDFFELFDGGVASCDVHINKPDPRIYTKLMKQYHLAYDESVFIDDNKTNAQAAYNLGITGILYKNHKSFTRALGLCGIQAKGIELQQKKHPDAKI
ncbi:MAG: HAD family hydrolase [Gemmiger sp.]